MDSSEGILVCRECDTRIEEACSECGNCREHCTCATFHAITIAEIDAEDLEDADDEEDDDADDAETCEHGISFDEECPECDTEEEEDADELDDEDDGEEPA